MKKSRHTREQTLACCPKPSRERRLGRLPQRWNFGNVLCVKEEIRELGRERGVGSSARGENVRLKRLVARV